jgi:hypothetical protein
MNHTAISAPSRAAAVCRRRASFPRLIESLVPECWRDVILAGRSRKSSATFGTPAIVSLGERLPQAINTEPLTQDAGPTLDVRGAFHRESQRNSHKIVQRCFTKSSSFSLDTITEIVCLANSRRSLQCTEVR